MSTILDIDEIDRAVVASRSQAVVEAERQCRIALAEDYHYCRSRDNCACYIELSWNPGGRNGRLSIIKLEPGKSVVQPLAKAQSWFGPFSVPGEYAKADDAKRESLKEFWAREKERYLLRYDYPRGDGRGQQPDMRPVGHHRSPDVTVTIIDNDGSEQPPIRLYALYKIGPFDPLKDEIEERIPHKGESVEAVRARAEAELEAAKTEHLREVEALRREMAELTGLVKGKLLASAPGK